MNLTLSETPKSGFVASRPIYDPTSSPLENSPLGSLFRCLVIARAPRPEILHHLDCVLRNSSSCDVEPEGGPCFYTDTAHPWFLPDVPLIPHSFLSHQPAVNRGSYISTHVLLNLLNELGKRDKMRGLPSILSLFRNEFNKINNKRARMLDSIYHMTLRLL